MTKINTKPTIQEGPIYLVISMTKYQTNNTRRTNISSDLHDKVPNQQYKKDQYI